MVEVYSFIILILIKGGIQVFKVGEMVRWRKPTEPMYSYGEIVGFENRRALIKCIDYYDGLIVEVHIRQLRKLLKGGKGGGCGK